MTHITAIFGRRWFRKSAGNSYGRAIIALSSGDTLYSPVFSGGGEHYLGEGLEHAARHGFALRFSEGLVQVGDRVTYYADTFAGHDQKGVVTHVHCESGFLSSVQAVDMDGMSFAVGASRCRFFSATRGCPKDESTSLLRSLGVAYAHADVAREKDL